MWINPVTQELSEEPLDGYEMILSTQPPLTGRLEKAVQSTPEQIDGTWQQTWRIESLTDAEEAQVVEAERVNLRAATKAFRTAAVQAIKVTTQAGNTFDGDEVSQDRMARAILVLPEGATIPWTLADNTSVPVTSAELREALLLAGTAQSAIW